MRTELLKICTKNVQINEGKEMKLSKSEYKQVLNGLTATKQDMAFDILEELRNEGAIVLKEDTPICIICNELAEHKKLGKDLCTYHYDLANDHKRDRD